MLPAALVGCHSCLLRLQVQQIGETLLTIGGSSGWGPAEHLPTCQMDIVLQALQGQMGAMQADMTLLRRRVLPGASRDDSGQPAVNCGHQHMLFLQTAAPSQLSLRPS